MKKNQEHDPASPTPRPPPHGEVCSLVSTRDMTTKRPNFHYPGLVPLKSRKLCIFSLFLVNILSALVLDKPTLQNGAWRSHCRSQHVPHRRVDATSVQLPLNA